MPKTIESPSGRHPIKLRERAKFLVVEAVRTLVKQTIHPYRRRSSTRGIPSSLPRSSLVAFLEKLNKQQCQSVEFQQRCTDHRLPWLFFEGKGKGRRPYQAQADQRYHTKASFPLS